MSLPGVEATSLRQADTQLDAPDSQADGGSPMFDAAFIANPYPTYAKLRESAPLHWMPEFGSGAWLVPRYQDVVRALREPRLSAKRSHRFVAQYAPEQQAEFSEFNSHFAKWLVFLDPPRHAVWRKLIAKGFSAAMINEARPR